MHEQCAWPARSELCNPCTATQDVPARHSQQEAEGLVAREFAGEGDWEGGRMQETWFWGVEQPRPCSMVNGPYQAAKTLYDGQWSLSSSQDLVRWPMVPIKQPRPCSMVNGHTTMVNGHTTM
eukprot:320467-Chlamydomonas_euryale.AAC.1